MSSTGPWTRGVGSPVTGSIPAMEQVITITPAALERILELRESEGIPDLHLGLRISGVGSQGFLYETAFLRAEDVAADDHVEDHDGLPVAIPPDSVDDLRGAELDLVDGGGLVLRNPNVPAPPTIGMGPPPELSGSVEEKVRTLLEGHINPAIAAHGGIAFLVGVEDDRVLLQLGGGCQGCGLAAVTLREGIERTILELVPEVREVVDVTDHAAGVDPFYR